MCLGILSTAHPSYRLILINNRDEDLTRPTAPADWWHGQDAHILGGRDLLRPDGGSWLGVTKDGRIAVLTNYLDGRDPVGMTSRGNVLLSFLREPSSKPEAQSLNNLIHADHTKDVGGFNLVCGKIGGELAVVSNRYTSPDGLHWIMGSTGQTVAISNTIFGDRTWPKIARGEEAMAAALHDSHASGESEDALIERLLGLLSSDELPRCSDGSCELNMENIAASVMVPLVDWKGLDSGSGVVEGQQEADRSDGRRGQFATQKQTIVLADHAQRVKFFERTLFDEHARSVEKGNGDKVFEFYFESDGPSSDELEHCDNGA